MDPAWIIAGISIVAFIGGIILLARSVSRMNDKPTFTIPPVAERGPAIEPVRALVERSARQDKET